VQGINKTKVYNMKKRILQKHCPTVNRSESSEYQMRILDQRREMFKFETDDFSASWLADSKPDWVPAMLYFEVTDSLRGFTPEMALIIADDIIDCWTGLGLNFTGLEHIDDLLSRLYGKILSCAFKKRIKIANHY